MIHKQFISHKLKFTSKKYLIIKKMSSRNKRNKRNNQSVQYSLHAKLSFNISIVGKKSMGKSSLIIREIKDTYGNLPKNTGGFQFYSKTFKRKNQDISIQFWDTAGKSEYNSMTRNFFRQAAAIILVYDRIDGLEDQLDALRKQLNEYAHQAVKICLVRTKIDVNQVKQEERQKLKHITEVLHQNSVCFCGQVSAKTNQNLHKYFSDLTDLMFKCYQQDQNFRQCVKPVKDSFLLNSVTKNPNVQKKKRNCC